MNQGTKQMKKRKQKDLERRLLLMGINREESNIAIEQFDKPKNISKFR